MTYNETTDHLTWRGPMTFTNPSKNFTLAGAGVGAAAPDSGAYRVRTMLTFEATMPAKSVETLAANLAKPSRPRMPSATRRTTCTAWRRLAATRPPATLPTTRWARPRRAAKALAQIPAHAGAQPRGPALECAGARLVLAMGPLGVGGVGKQPFNALMNGLLEIKRVEGAGLRGALSGAFAGLVLLLPLRQECARYAVAWMRNTTTPSAPRPSTTTTRPPNTACSWAIWTR
ncbi:MAG: hypothetical protein WKG07_01655 [Hymenobacter sp.]